MSHNETICALYNLVDEVAEISGRVQEIERHSEMPFECRALIKDTLYKLRDCKENLFACSLGVIRK